MLKKLDLKIRRDIDQSKYISFLIKDDELQENIIEFGKKVENSITKEFGSEPVYNEKYLKAKINLVMEKSTHIFTIIRFSIYLFISFNRFCFRIAKNYYPQVYLEECKYIVKEKKMPNYITEARKRYQNLSEENKTKCKKRP